MPNIQQRKTIRLKEYNYSLPGEYFVTICAKDKQCLFGEVTEESVHLSPISEIVEQCWERIPKHFPGVGLDEYVVMPNHFHGIIIINEIDIIRRGEVTSPLPQGNVPSSLHKPTLGKIVVYFKYQSTKLINESQATPGAKVWQRNYYDRIIRNEKELQNIQDYIVNNALTWAFETEHSENIPL